jgi:hypothetical protein
LIPNYFPLADAAGGAAPFASGYMGRLTPEKNVRLFVDLERSLLAAGQLNFRFMMVEEGNERDWLWRSVPNG